MKSDMRAMGGRSSCERGGSSGGRSSCRRSGGKRLTRAAGSDGWEESRKGLKGGRWKKQMVGLRDDRSDGRVAGRATDRASCSTARRQANSSGGGRCCGRGELLFGLPHGEAFSLISPSPFFDSAWWVFCVRVSLSLPLSSGCTVPLSSGCTDHPAICPFQKYYYLRSSKFRIRENICGGGTYKMKSE